MRYPHQVMKEEQEASDSTQPRQVLREAPGYTPTGAVKIYRKKGLQPMRPYVPGEDLTGVSVSEEDTPELGGMIAVGTDNKARWYVSKLFFNENYVEV